MHHHRTALRAITVGALSATLGVASFAGTAVADSSRPAASMSSEASSKQKKTVVAVAKSSDDFSTLVTAVGAARLVKALSAKGPFTVFAPTNAAFEEIPAADLGALLANKKGLTKVLTYHVIKGRILAKDLEPTQTVKTLQGDELTIDVADDGTATITDSNGNVVSITATDLKAKNGVVHVIDGVLTPAS